MTEINLSNIPAYMKELHAWVVSWHKRPIRVDRFDPSLVGGDHEYVFDLSWKLPEWGCNWNTFEYVEKWVGAESTKGFNFYPGFLLDERWDILFIDLDYVDPVFVLTPDDESLIKRSGTYAEWSMNGRIHLYAKISPEQKAVFQEKSGGSGELSGNGIQLFIDKRHCVCTGNKIECSSPDVAQIPEELFNELLSKTNDGENSKAINKTWHGGEKWKTPIKKIKEGERHGKLIAYAGYLSRQKKTEVEAGQKIRWFNNEWCEPPLSESRLKDVFRGFREFVRRHKEAGIVIETPLDVPPEVDKIITERTPQEVTRLAYADVHSGDQEICDLSVRAFCAGREITNDGIQPKAAGKTAVGKTAAFEASVWVMPKEFVRVGSVSDKALFYTKIQPGTVFFIDDANLHPDLIGTFKTSMSRFQSENIYTTLDKNRDVIYLTIPPRCTFLFTSVDDLGDEQLINRFTPCNLYDHSAAKSAEIDKFFASKDKKGEPQYVVTDNVRASRKLLFDIGIRRFRVIVPFSDKIQWETTDVRLKRSFMTLLKANAVFNYKKRENVFEPDGTISVTATKEDFNFVYEMSRFKNKRIAEGRLTPGESTVIRMMFQLKPRNYSNGSDWVITQKDLVELGKDKRYNISKSQISQALHGRENRGTLGLIQKTPGMIVEDVSNTTGHSDGERVTIRGNLITVPGTLGNPDDIQSACGVASLIE